MKRGYRRLDLRPRSFLADAVNLKDRTRTISNMHHAILIECYARSDAEVPRKCNCLLEWCDLVDNSFETAGHEHRAVRTKHDPDRKSTRLNSSHGYISYAVFCLKKKK